MRKLLMILMLVCIVGGGVTLATDLESLCSDRDAAGDNPGHGSTALGWSNDEGDDEADDEGDDEGDDSDFCVCHFPHGNPDNAHTICVGLPALCVHLGHGDTLGPCAETCGGTEGTECPDGQFCKYPEGECAEDAEGECMDLPGACPGLYDPVCGCDGNPYSNRCYADVAGVGVAQEGVCEDQQACGGIAGETCEDDQFCLRPVGECSMDAEGVCIVVPEACPSVFRPVCGCDEMTYDNACLALAAGVSIAAPGACDDAVACGGAEGDTCEDGQFCKARPGMCEEGAEGICADQPDACPPVFMPVCGCDDVTYDNRCLADAAGATVASMGACKDDGMACIGDGADTCTAEQFCWKKKDGQCSDDAEGTCIDKPTRCSTHLSPVCGCDDVTYDNACFAAEAGVNVAMRGECEEVAICGGTDGIECGTGEFCIGETGACADEDEGVCMEKPALCPPEVEPVCGCDEQNYTNRCFAHAAGVTVQNEGACASTAKATRGARRGWLRSP